MNQIEYEQHIVHRMLLIYCKRNHNSKNSLCETCVELKNYAFLRLEKCKFGNQKPACKACPVHCYKPEMREKIREVMRFSGPRMAWYYPVDSIKHLFHQRKKG